MCTNPEDVREISVETATEYLSAISDGAGRIALGVSLCIFSPVPLFIFSGMSEAGLIFPTEDAAGGVGTGVLQQGDYTIEKKRENKRMEVFGGVYWGIITAVYLGISFLCASWHVSWVIWPVAGVAFAAVRSIVSAVHDR